MRRKDRAVTDPAKIRAVLAECQVCRLGLRDGDRVYVVPLNFGLAEREGKQFLYFHGAKEGRKADLIRQGGCACFEMDTGYRLPQHHRGGDRRRGDGPCREGDGAQRRHAPVYRAGPVDLRPGHAGRRGDLPAGGGEPHLQGTPVTPFEMGENAYGYFSRH